MQFLKAAKSFNKNLLTWMEEMPGYASPFSADLRIWIVKKFGEVKSATLQLVRRAFQREFPRIDPKKLPHQRLFSRVIEKIEASCDVGDPKVKRKPWDTVPQCDVKSVMEFFFQKMRSCEQNWGLLLEKFGSY